MIADNFFATCPRGLESLLAQELTELGGQQVTAQHGGVAFQGDLLLAYRINLYSRIASRVLWQVARGTYRNEEDIYKGVVKLPWSKWVRPELTMLVKVTAIKSPLKSLNFITLKIKDAVCDRLREDTGSRPSIDTVSPDFRVHVFLEENRYIAYLDTSGDSLYKRGFRQETVIAPLRENLAAGIIKLSGWQPGTPFLDPMCGSGTFLIEAAMMALNIAPGLKRGFAFEKFGNFNAAGWQALRKEAQAQVKEATTLPIWGSDKDIRAVRIAQKNLAAAGLDAAVTVQPADVLEITPPAESGVVIANPPYGVRIGEETVLQDFYPQLATAMKQKFAGWKVCLFSGDPSLPKLIRLKPSRKTPLFNGALECRLFEYQMVAGSNRDKPAAD